MRSPSADPRLMFPLKDWLRHEPPNPLPLNLPAIFHQARLRFYRAAAKEALRLGVRPYDGWRLEMWPVYNVGLRSTTFGFQGRWVKMKLLTAGAPSPSQPHKGRKEC